MKKEYSSSTAIVVVLAAVLLVFMTGPAQAQVSYKWNFDEGSGTTVTDTTGKYPAFMGALVDLPESSEDSPSGQAGDRSILPIGGFEIDDSDNPILDVQAGPVTIEAWMKPNSLDGWRDLCRIGNSIKAGFNGENLVFTLLGIVDVNTDVVMPIDGAWHHVAYAWDPGVGATFFLDGEEQLFIEETRGARDFQNNLVSIGSAHNGASEFDGLIDRFRVHHAVLTADDLDSDAASPKAPLGTTLLSYSFDEETSPYQNGTSTDRPAISMAQRTAETSSPSFSSDSPTGENTDYSLFFDGDDRVTYDDNESFFFDFIDEPFTFEVWLKFKAEEQVANRPVFFSYGVGGQGGYSFSFRPAGASTDSVADSPTGQAGDMSIRPNSGLVATDLETPVLPPKEGPLTIEAWVKPDSLTGWTDISRLGNSLKAGFSNDHPVFTLLGIVDLIANFTVPVDGSWHHIAYVWDPGTKVSFYLDGQFMEELASSDVGRDFQNNGISVGASHTGSSPFDGLIDRFRMHQAVVAPDDLDSNAATPKAPLNSTVIAYNFDEPQPPYANVVGHDIPADNRGNFLTVTTFGIVDAHSDAEIPNDGNWHHVAAVFDWDGFAFKFYVDSILKDTLDYDQGVNPAPENENFLYFGSERGGGLPYVGLLDRVTISRAALTPDQFDYFVPVSVGDWSLY